MTVELVIPRPIDENGFRKEHGRYHGRFWSWGWRLTGSGRRARVVGCNGEGEVEADGDNTGRGVVGL